MTALCDPALVDDGDAAALEAPEDTAADAAEALLRTTLVIEVALARAVVACDEEAIDEPLDEEAPEVEATELPEDVPDRLPVLDIPVAEPEEADEDAETAAVTTAAPL